MDYRRRHQGLISVQSKVPVKDSHALSLVYTPRVTEPYLEIERDPRRSFDVACRGNTVAIGLLAGLINIGRLLGKNLQEMKVVINRAGAAGLGTAFLLHRYGLRNTIVCDRTGAIYK